MAKFTPKQTLTVRTTTIEIGRRSNKGAFKIILPGGSTFIIDSEQAEDLADAIDEALYTFESDPLLWEGSS